MVSFRTFICPLFPPKKFLGWNFFCRFLQQDSSSITLCSFSIILQKDTEIFSYGRSLFVCHNRRFRNLRGSETSYSAKKRDKSDKTFWIPELCLPKQEKQRVKNRLITTPYSNTKVDAATTESSYQ